MNSKHRYVALMMIIAATAFVLLSGASETNAASDFNKSDSVPNLHLMQFGYPGAIAPGLLLVAGHGGGSHSGASDRQVDRGGKIDRSPNSSVNHPEAANTGSVTGSTDKTTSGGLRDTDKRPGNKIGSGSGAKPDTKVTPLSRAEDRVRLYGIIGIMAIQ
ncbi:MAG: hypothetical protein ABSG91_19285 [Syntrophobacteraceae bacterium]